MKQEPSQETVGMTAFDLPNSQNPHANFNAYYGNQHVPRPNNTGAMKVDHAKVMRQVNEGK